jgi:hypothetical protein
MRACASGRRACIADRAVSDDAGASARGCVEARTGTRLATRLRAAAGAAVAAACGEGSMGGGSGTRRARASTL